MLIMKSIIIYFSLTGNTEKLARLIRKSLSKRDIDVEELRLKGGEGNFIKESLSALFSRKILIEKKELKKYNLIFLGSPVWAFSPVPAIVSFVKNVENLSEKKVFLFFTYGSGTGRRRAERVLRNLVEDRGGEVISTIQIKGRLMKMPERVEERVKFFLDTSLPNETNSQERKL